MTPSELYKNKSAKAGIICSWMAILNILVIFSFEGFRGGFPLWVRMILSITEGSLVIGSFVSGLICVIAAHKAREKDDKKIG
jgi:hypothetical protein